MIAQLFTDALAFFRIRIFSLNNGFEDKNQLKTKFRFNIFNFFNKCFLRFTC